MTMTSLELAVFYVLAGILFLLCVGLTFSRCFRTGVFGTLGLGSAGLAVLSLLLDAWSGSDYQLLRQTGLLVAGFTLFLTQTVWRIFKHNRLVRAEEAQVLSFPTRVQGFAYLEIIVPLALILALLGATQWWSQQRYAQGFAAGELKERAAQEAARSAARDVRDAELAELQTRARTRERQLAAVHAQTLDHLTQENDRALKEKDDVIAALRAGSGSLQFLPAPLYPFPLSTCSGLRCVETDLTAPTPGAARPPSGGLSGEPAVFLYQLADRADRYTRERNAAVDLLDAYEKACLNP